MISFVNGKVIEKFSGSVVVDVGGLGYEVQLAATDFERVNLDAESRFYTYHHVREQAEDLFGFSALAAKRLFELLITVQGVGPKAALAILSLGEAEAVRSAIASADVAFVARASGVGKKTAERVTVDLRDKVGAPTYVPGHDLTTGAISNLAGDEALDALMALGYNLAEATEALAGIDPSLPTAKRVSEALKDRK
ncbi:MAG TPA: Holliday junction branch migration protein RuvA [Candidatus Nanoperiomorbaceae bacterium]|nr:Holliday junction branch migration protein RuvA [Candidatus Nanoperiomorbaceae bacterium]HMQ97203.1 Holliday junction branch migration protein RuvA [Candidatus Nanoperiomorbaceae bacterium]HMR86493.1 Holliday junction branch migration protein RuvA [Candidatus Nanoperiomorbaceae bacterium]HMU12111.1 Holliday junction branch migration protein RuvA [Candidatus Nanoperiomorbaceae bacterium]